MPRRKNKHPNSFAGRGMKPRGNAEEAKVESAQTENVVSTDQVQPEGTNEAGKTALQGEQTPPSQEAETRIPDLIEAAVVVPGSSLLAELLKRSAEKPEDDANVKPNLEPAAVLGAIKKDEEERHAAAKKPDPAHTPIKPAPEADPILQTTPTRNGGYSFKFAPGKSIDKIQIYEGNNTVPFNLERVGTLENGDCNVVVTIPESYVTSVKDFAEADGNKTPEQWCSEFFVMHLEAYCTPNRGR